MRNLTVAWLCCFFLPAYAQHATDVPTAVKAAFWKEHPKARHLKWHATGYKYRAFFTSSHQRHAILFSSSGKIIGSAITLKHTWLLPSRIRKGLSTSIYHDWYVEEIQRLHTTDDEILYRITLNNSNLLDGDHYDNYLEHQNLYISDAGVLMPPPVDLYPLVCPWAHAAN